MRATDIARDTEVPDINMLPVPVLVFDNVADSFIVVSANVHASDLLAVDPEHLLGRSLSGVFGMADEHILQKIGGCVDEVIVGGRKCELSAIPYLHPVDNSLIYLNLSIQCAGSKLILVMQDVTGFISKSNELAGILKGNEQLLNDTQVVAGSGTWEMDLQTGVMKWSDGLKILHEVDLDYQPTADAFHQFYRNETMRELVTASATEAINKNKPFEIELEIITAKGNLKWLRCTGKADNVAGEPPNRIYGTAHDITPGKTLEIALRAAYEKYQVLLDTVDGIVWEAEADTFRFTFVSNKVEAMLGYTQQEFLSQPDFWVSHIYEPDRHFAVSFCQLRTSEAKDHTFEYRMAKANGDIIWIRDLVSVVTEDGKPCWLRGIMVDVTETKTLAELDRLEKEVLELNHHREIGIKSILDAYVKGLEELFPNILCSVLGVKNNKIIKWASPSLPAEYIDSIDGREIGPMVGSCGTAAYRKELVIVADIATDEKWALYKDDALKHGLRACWSFPVISSEGNVIAVFAVYYKTVKEPGAEELAIVERSAAILKILLENRLFEEMMQEMNSLIIQGQQLANFGNWQWDIEENKVSWSEALYDIYGLNKHTSPSTFEAYLEILYPEDRERVKGIITNTLQTQKDVVFEERIVRPNGDIRHLRSWGRVIANADGAPVKMIGSCLDVTSVKITESKMEEIAWLQSHVIRAPLARLMGLVSLLQNELSPGSRQDELVSHIMNSAEELDTVIRKITRNTL